MAFPAAGSWDCQKQHTTNTMAPFIEDTSFPQESTQFAPWSVEEVLDQLTIDEKVSLLAGTYHSI
jgi:hypothetical protein